MRVESARRRRRAGRFGTRALALACTALLLAVTGTSAAIYVMASGARPAAGFFLRPQPGSIPWNGHDPLTMLLLGTQKDPPALSTAGSVMIASYQPAIGQITVLSLPSNLWVTVPGYGQTTVGQAYADGGPRLALLTVESVTHIPIRYYFVAGPGIFGGVVQSVGGVSLDVRQPAPAGMRRSGGAHLLSASQAMHLVQSTGSDDAFGAMERRAGLLVAIKERLLSADGLLRIPPMVNALGSLFSTNFPYSRLLDLAGRVGDLPRKRIHLISLGNGDGTLTSYRTAGTTVLVPDWQRVQQVVRSIFGDPSLHVGARVEVLNGSGVAGQAAQVAAWLRQADIRVRGYASAGTFDHLRTTVQLSRTASSADRHIAVAVASLLQVPLIIRAPTHRGSPIVVTIGKDFQDLTQQ